MIFINPGKIHVVRLQNLIVFMETMLCKTSVLGVDTHAWMVSSGVTRVKYFVRHGLWYDGAYDVDRAPSDLQCFNSQNSPTLYSQISPTTDCQMIRYQLISNALSNILPLLKWYDNKSTLHKQQQDAKCHSYIIMMSIEVTVLVDLSIILSRVFFFASIVGAPIYSSHIVTSTCMNVNLAVVINVLVVV